MQVANRVVFNTGVLYIRMLLTVGISLYATRLVLNILGATDYGIYSLVGGTIALLSFLSAAMTASTQRYLSFYEGKKDLEMQKKVFANSLLIHFFIGILLIAALIIASLFLFNGFLNIPPERIPTSKAVYYLMTITVFISILSAPFAAALNTHENMLWFAIVGIIDVVLKLLAAISLYFVHFDQLLFYTLMILLINLFTFALHAIFCVRKYPECSFHTKKRTDKSLMKELTSFAGWNLFGSLCFFGKSQGLAIVLNLFLGTIVNAAYGIANQVSGQLSFFSQTMLLAINPQIMKSEGNNDRQRMLKLSMIASKFSFFLLAVLAIPCIFEMPVILSIWLKNVPEYTVVLCSLILVAMMINQLTIGLDTAVQATGKIKSYMIVTGSVKLLILPVALIMLYLGFPLHYVFVSYALLELISGFFRIFIINKVGGLSSHEYYKRVIFKFWIPVAATVIIDWLIINCLSFDYRFLLTITTSIITFSVVGYFWGLFDDERLLVNNLVLNLTNKIPYLRKK